MPDPQEVPPVGLAEGGSTAGLSDARPGEAAPDGPERSGVTVGLVYRSAIDELVLNMGDGHRIEVFEPWGDDVKLIFDATKAGCLVGLILRGARLGRSEAWLRAVAIILGPTLWSAYQAMARPTPGRIAGEDDELRGEIEVAEEEWRQLRYRSWVALHQSLLAGQWWDDQPPLAAHLEPSGEGGDAPWVLAAPLPPPQGASHLQLPRALARACGVEPVGFLRQSHGSLAVRFDLIKPQEAPARQLSLTLAGPHPSPAMTTLEEGELAVRFAGSLRGWSHLVVVAEARPEAPVPATELVAAEATQEAPVPANELATEGVLEGRHTCGA